MINTIAELIEHMENTELERLDAGKEYSAAYTIIEDWYNGVNKNIHKRIKEELYNKLYGMIYGLEAAHYISKQEKKKLLDEVMEHI